MNDLEKEKVIERLREVTNKVLWVFNSEYDNEIDMMIEKCDPTFMITAQFLKLFKDGCQEAFEKMISEVEEL